MVLVLQMNLQNLLIQKTFLFFLILYIYIYIKMDRLGKLLEFFVTTGIKTSD